MVISRGEKVHVITRRQFEADLSRHFAGVVEEAAEGIVRAVGYTCVYDQAKSEFVRRGERRTRLFGSGDAGLIINVLPETVDLESLRYSPDENGLRALTDAQGFEMIIGEFGAFR